MTLEWWALSLKRSLMAMIAMGVGKMAIAFMFRWMRWPGYEIAHFLAAGQIFIQRVSDHPTRKNGGFFCHVDG